MRHVGQAHEGRHPGKARQVKPRDRVEKSIAHVGPPRRLAGGHGAIPLRLDSFDGILDGFISHGHMKRVGMDQSTRFGHPGHMPLPEQQIAALQRRILGQRRAQLGLLHVAVAGARNTAGSATCLNKARAIDPERGITTPEIRGAMEQLGDLDRIISNDADFATGGLRVRRDRAELSRATKPLSTIRPNLQGHLTARRRVRE